MIDKDKARYGVVTHEYGTRPTDYLYRLSLKCLIMNASGEVLVVKERGRPWWDLPGGGMDHCESLREAIARELCEEVSLSGEFAYRVIHVEEPAYLEDHGFWQMRLVMQVTPQSFSFQTGGDSDAVEWINPEVFQDSDRRVEQLIAAYAQLATR